MIKCQCWIIPKKCVNNIIEEATLRLRNKDIREKLDVENIYYLIDKEIKGKFKTTKQVE